MYKNTNKTTSIKYNKKGKISTQPKSRNLIIPLSTKQKTKNACYKSIGTVETLKLIKNEKKLNIESIFKKK